MYAILRNSALQQKKREDAIASLDDFRSQLQSEGFFLSSPDAVDVVIRSAIRTNGATFATRLTDLLGEAARHRSPIYAKLPPTSESGPGTVAENALHLLESFIDATIVKFFSRSTSTVLSMNHFL
jgi:hypothetical protein